MKDFVLLVIYNYKVKGECSSSWCILEESTLISEGYDKYAMEGKSIVIPNDEDSENIKYIIDESVFDAEYEKIREEYGISQSISIEEEVVEMASAAEPSETVDDATPSNNEEITVEDESGISINSDDSIEEDHSIINEPNDSVSAPLI